MKRILFFNYEYPPLGGGAANATAYLLREYAKRDDVHVELITSAISDTYERIALSEHVIIHRVPIGKSENTLNYQTQRELLTYTWKAYQFAKKLLATESFDLTHSFFALPCGVISLVLKWQYKIPYIVSLRGADVPGYSERFVWIYRILTVLIRRVWKGARFVVTNSKGLTTLARTSSPGQVFHEIYNGIDTNLYTPGTRNAHDRRATFRILCAARLSHRKGFHYAIDALPEIVKRYPHVRLTFAGGDGGVMQKLKGQVQALSMQEYVTFSGHYTKEQASVIYRQADLFLMPSLNEGMSNNVLEALASGLPVLMTPTGGAEELVHNGENGFVITMKSSKDIVEKVSRFLDDDALCDRMGAASRAIAEQMNWRVAAEKYVALYKQVTAM